MPLAVVWILAVLIAAIDQSPLALTGAVAAALGFSLAYAVGESARGDLEQQRKDNQRLRKQLADEQSSHQRTQEALEERSRVAFADAWRNAWSDYEESLGGPDGIELARTVRDRFSQALRGHAGAELAWEDQVRCVQLSYRHFMRPHASTVADEAALLFETLTAMRHYLDTEPIPFLLPYADQQLQVIQTLLNPSEASTDAQGNVPTES